jgi:hypothetical protein
MKKSRLLFTRKLVTINRRQVVRLWSFFKKKREDEEDVSEEVVRNEEYQDKMLGITDDLQGEEEDLRESQESSEKSTRKKKTRSFFSGDTRNIVKLVLALFILLVIFSAGVTFLLHGKKKGEKRFHALKPVPQLTDISTASAGKSGSFVKENAISDMGDNSIENKSSVETVKNTKVVQVQESTAHDQVQERVVNSKFNGSIENDSEKTTRDVFKEFYDFESTNEDNIAKINQNGAYGQVPPQQWEQVPPPESAFIDQTLPTPTNSEQLPPIVKVFGVSCTKKEQEGEKQECVAFTSMGKLHEGDNVGGEKVVKIEKNKIVTDKRIITF